MATIVKGEDLTLTVNVVDASGNAFDVSDFSTFTAQFTRQDTIAVLNLTMTVLGATAGSLAVLVAASNSGLLNEGDRQSWQVILDNTATSRRIAQSLNSLSVKPSLFTLP